MNEKILITSATGKTGYGVTVQLLAEGYLVRIFVRFRNARAIELEKLGAEIALGTFDDHNQFKVALTGVSRVYYCYPIMPKLPQNVALFIKAAQEARIDAVVFMGQRIAEFDDTGSVMTNDTRTAYRLFAESGLNVVYFVPGYFADNAFVVTEFVLQLGLLASPFGPGKKPWISNGDMSRSIAALLKNPAPYYGKKLVPTGPASISTNEMAATFSNVSGRTVRVVNTPDWLFLKAGMMLGSDFGFDPFAIVQGSFYNRQMRLNRFDIAPTDVVKHLTGREPDNFETITREYFDRSPYRERSLVNWLSAMKKLMAMPLTPVPSANERKLLNQ